MTRAALLLSPYDFEDFYETGLGLTRETYVSEYRNDFAWEYCKQLKEHGLATVLYLPSLDHGGREPTPDGFAVRFLPLGVAWRAWRRLLPVLGRTPFGRYLAEAVNAASLLGSIRRALREDEIDVLYIQEYWTARFDVLVRLVGVPVVAGEQGGSGGVQLHVGKRRSFARAYKLICQRPREARRLARYGAPTVVIPKGVDTEFFTPDGDGERGELLLTVARLEDGQKRISDLIRALALLPEPWRLEIAGMGPDEEALRSQTRHMDLEARVTFSGFVGERERLRDKYRSSTVFALVSDWEGFALAALEAMSCGTPVVLSRISGFEGMVTEGVDGYTVPVGRPDLIAPAVLSAAARREELGAAARRAVESRFAARSRGAELASLLEAAASGGRAN